MISSHYRATTSSPPPPVRRRQKRNSVREDEDKHIWSPLGVGGAFEDKQVLFKPSVQEDEARQEEEEARKRISLIRDQVLETHAKADVKSSKHIIHSGQFMLSQLWSDQPAANSSTKNTITTSGYANLPSLNSGVSKKLPIPSCDLEHLFTHIIKQAYQTTSLISPRWRQFKGLELDVPSKVRLNNLIWRTWFMQFKRRVRHPMCAFVVPDGREDHSGPEAVVMEGKYWRRQNSVVVSEYISWRWYFKLKNSGRFECYKEFVGSLQFPREHHNLPQTQVRGSNADFIQHNLSQFQIVLPVDLMDIEPFQPRTPLNLSSWEEFSGLDLDSSTSAPTSLPPTISQPIAPQTSPSISFNSRQAIMSAPSEPQTAPVLETYSNERTRQDDKHSPLAYQPDQGMSADASPSSLSPHSSVPPNYEVISSHQLHLTGNLKQEQAEQLMQTFHARQRAAEMAARANSEISPVPDSMNYNAPTLNEYSITEDSQDQLTVTLQGGGTFCRRYHSLPEAEKGRGVLVSPNTPPPSMVAVHNQLFAAQGTDADGFVTRAGPLSDQSSPFLRSVESRSPAILGSLTSPNGLPLSAASPGFANVHATSGAMFAPMSSAGHVLHAADVRSMLNVASSFFPPVRANGGYPTAMQQVPPPVSSAASSVAAAALIWQQQQQHQQRLQQLQSASSRYDMQTPSSLPTYEGHGVNSQTPILKGILGQLNAPGISNIDRKIMESEEMKSLYDRIDPAVVKYQRLRDKTPEELSQHRERREKVHQISERKRRHNIQVALNHLQEKLPQTGDQKNKMFNTRAYTLQRAYNYIEQLENERSNLKKSIVNLKEELARMNHEIGQIHRLLPSDQGVMEDCLNDQNCAIMRQQFQSYVSDKSQNCWRFFIFSHLARKFFDSFVSAVRLQSFETFSESVNSWISERCTMVNIRAVVTESLTELCVKDIPYTSATAAEGTTPRAF